MLVLEKIFNEHKEIKRDIITKYDLKKINEKLHKVKGYDFKLKDLEIIKNHLIQNNILPEDYDTGALLNEIE